MKADKILKKGLMLCTLGISIHMLGIGVPSDEFLTGITVSAASDNFLRRGQETVIDYSKQYDAYVDSKEKAAMAIKEYGKRQRALYENPEVTELELQMEEKYGILSVTLGEIDLETAKDIEAAFAYMYQKYPVLYGTLTNLSLANFPAVDGSELAITQSREFMINQRPGNPPFVMKTEILLNAVKFFDREKLMKECSDGAKSGHWPEGMDITTLVVHELGHQLMDVVRMMEYGLYDGTEYSGYYITEEMTDAFADCMTDSISMNQTVNRRTVEQGYQIWQDTYGELGTPEEFRASISEYAVGKQTDGGISYGETISEAIADVYLHGEEAANASKAIVSVIFPEEM